MTLRLDQILASTADFEQRQYLVQKGLKEYSGEFSRNKLYPFLSELVDLHSSLQNLLDRQEDITDHLPKELTGIDLESKQLIYEQAQEMHQNIDEILRLTVWALPLIREVMEEGMDIHNFVEENIAIIEVGLSPIYRDEGYWIVPDLRLHQLHLLRYEVSLFTSSTERYRTLKTQVLESVEKDDMHNTPESIKWMLIKKYNDLPNPATFVCDTELDFPYGETILPVAKRKLMAHLCS